MALPVKTSLPALPASAAPDLRMYLERVREELMRARGDIDSTTIIVRNYGTGTPGTPNGPPIPGVPGGTLPCGAPVTPTAPTGVRVTAGFSFFMVEWDYPSYCGHAYTEIYGTQDNAAPGTEVLLGTSGGTMFTLAEPGTGVRRCFWVKHVNLLGARGAANATEGTCATTALDPGVLIDALTGQITASQLYRTLGDRIDLIDLPGTGLIDKTAYLQTTDGVLAQRIEETSAALENLEVIAVTIGPTAPPSPLVGDIWYDTTDPNKVTMKSWNGTAWLVTRTDVKTFLQPDPPQNTNANGAGYTTVKPFVSGDLWYDTNDNNKPYYWTGSAWVDLLSGYVNNLAEAKIVNFESAKIGYCTINGETTDYDSRAECEAAGGLWNQGLPWATAVKQVGVTAPNGQKATIQQEFDAIYGAQGLRAQYTVKIDNGGRVSGFGLASTATDGGGVSSAFAVRADRFYIAAPQDSGSSLATIPFIVQTTSQPNPDGGTIPPGVYITDAYIKDATITTAKVKNAAITNAKIQDLRAEQILAGSLAVGRCITSDAAASDGNKLWSICANGAASFRALTIYDDNGQVLLSSGTGVAGPGVNLVPSSLFFSLPTTPPTPNPTVTPWFMFNSVTTGSATLKYNDVWAPRPAGLDTIVLYKSGLTATTTGSYSLVNSGFFAVVPNGRYEAYGYVVALYCDVNLQVQWYTAGPDTGGPGTLIRSDTVGVTPIPRFVGDLNLIETWAKQRVEAFVLAPATAAVARLTIQVSKADAGRTYAYMALARPFFGRAGTSQSEYSKWYPNYQGPITWDSRSTYIKDAAIDSAAIKDLTADKITAGTIKAAEYLALGSDATPVIDTTSTRALNFYLDGRSRALFMRTGSGTVATNYRTRLKLGLVSQYQGIDRYGLLVTDANGKIVISTAGTAGVTGTDAQGDAYPGTEECFISSAYIKKLRTGSLNSNAVSVANYDSDDTAYLVGTGAFVTGAYTSLTMETSGNSGVLVTAGANIGATGAYSVGGQVQILKNGTNVKGCNYWLSGASEITVFWMDTAPSGNVTYQVRVTCTAAKNSSGFSVTGGTASIFNSSISALGCKR